MIKYILLFSFAVILGACGSKNSEAKDQARQSIQDRVSNADPVVNFPDAAGSAGIVHHYICPNNCEGSGGAAQGNCPVCGTAYVHNQAFHNQPAANNPAANPSPAQNAAGVYHYICSNGCAGGAGAQGNCAVCGNALVHNSAYHN